MSKKISRGNSFEFTEFNDSNNEDSFFEDDFHEVMSNRNNNRVGFNEVTPDYLKSSTTLKLLETTQEGSQQTQFQKDRNKKASMLTSSSLKTMKNKGAADDIAKDKMKNIHGAPASLSTTTLKPAISKSFDNMKKGTNDGVKKDDKAAQGEVDKPNNNDGRSTTMQDDEAAQNKADKVVVKTGPKMKDGPSVVESGSAESHAESDSDGGEGNSHNRNHEAVHRIESPDYQEIAYNIFGEALAGINSRRIFDCWEILIISFITCCVIVILAMAITISVLHREGHSTALYGIKMSGVIACCLAAALLMLWFTYLWFKPSAKSQLLLFSEAIEHASTPAEIIQVSRAFILERMTKRQYTYSVKAPS